MVLSQDLTNYSTKSNTHFRDAGEKSTRNSGFDCSDIVDKLITTLYYITYESLPK